MVLSKWCSTKVQVRQIKTSQKLKLINLPKFRLFLSPIAYQRVQIVSTIDHGNVLILDGAVNLAENDTESYTHTLMNVQNVSTLVIYLHIFQIRYLPGFLFFRISIFMTKQEF